jgi:amidohydrolase
MLTNSDVVELTTFRRLLHRHPDLSRDEGKTAARIVAALGQLAPDQVVTDLGGHGVLAVYDGAAPGPTVLFRCELDALPIHEISDAAHRSVTEGKAHLCGHDGHMTILLGLARVLSRKPPAKGRVILMFQPAEEDGSGAAAVIADPAFAPFHPDWAFSLHNMPGCRRGAGWLVDGPVNCASVGLQLTLTGKTSHAAQPEFGRSPALAMARLIPALIGMGPGGDLGPDYRLVTITHALLGERSFGVSPAHGEIWATLRTMTDAPMAALKDSAVALAKAEAEAAGLDLAVAYHDDFGACANDPQATALLARALEAHGIAYDAGDLPERASEDFGRFSALPGTKGAMYFLGAGAGHPALHNPDYDFPDDLIAPGVAVFDHVTRQLLGP